jgi:hypothetical protein
MFMKLKVIFRLFYPDFLKLGMDSFCSIHAGDSHTLKAATVTLEMHTGGCNCYAFSQQLEPG